MVVSEQAFSRNFSDTMLIENAFVSAQFGVMQEVQVKGSG